MNIEEENQNANTKFMNEKVVSKSKILNSIFHNPNAPANSMAKSMINGTLAETAQDAVEAFERFADRCRTREIRKFTGSLVQNIRKGNAGLAECLQMLAAEQWEEKKNYVRKKAAASEQKLLFPMLLIFAAVIMMIIIPIGKISNRKSL